MAVSIGLTENVKVEIGELRNRLIHDLDSHDIKYEIPFDKLNKDGVKETIVHIKDIGTEISMENDIITYIKLGNTEFTRVGVLEDIKTDILTHVKGIQEKVRSLLSIEDYSIKIEKLDTETMNITLVLTSSTNKVRIQILRDSFGVVFINTMRTI